jgi:hypothetical protein
MLLRLEDEMQNSIVVMNGDGTQPRSDDALAQQHDERAWGHRLGAQLRDAVGARRSLGGGKQKLMRDPWGAQEQDNRVGFCLACPHALALRA